MTDTTAQRAAEQLADEVLRRRQEYADLNIEPHHRGALQIPQLVVETLGLPPDRFEEVARIYDQQLRQAIARQSPRPPGSYHCESAPGERCSSIELSVHGLNHSQERPRPTPGSFLYIGRLDTSGFAVSLS